MSKATRWLSSFFLVLSATAALAQGKPAIVQDRDEPGRNPYQQTIQITQDTTTCGALMTLCQALFEAVPSGMRLVVTHASVTYHADPASDDALVYSGPLQLPTFAHLLPMPAVRNGTRHVAAGPVFYVAAEGAQPYIVVSSGISGLTTGKTATFSLSGYFVAVP